MTQFRDQGGCWQGLHFKQADARVAALLTLGANQRESLEKTDRYGFA